MEVKIRKMTHFLLLLLTIYSCDTLPIAQLTEKQFRSGARSLDGTNDVFMISGYSQVRKQGGRSLQNPIKYPTLKVKSPNQLNVGAVSKVKNRLADPVFEKNILENPNSDQIDSPMEENIVLDEQVNTTIALSNENQDSKSITLSKDKVEQKILDQNKEILNDDTEDLIFETNEAIKDESINDSNNSAFVEFVEQSLEMSTILNLTNATKELLIEIAIENEDSTEGSMKSTIGTTSLLNEEISFSTIQPEAISQINERGIHLTKEDSEKLDILRKSVNEDEQKEQMDSSLIDFGDIKEI